MKRFTLYTLAIGWAAVSALALAGCGPRASEDKTSQVANDTRDDHAHAGHKHAGDAADTDPTHGGWWCVEHGVPEEECAMCDPRLAAELREKGDWCDEHTRPESLCFQCDPSRADKFIALYEAKYGKKPPEPTD